MEYALDAGDVLFRAVPRFDRFTDEVRARAPGGLRLAVERATWWRDTETSVSAWPMRPWSSWRNVTPARGS